MERVPPSSIRRVRAVSLAFLGETPYAAVVVLGDGTLQALTSDAGVEPGPSDDDRLLAAASYLTFMIGFGLVGPALIYAWKRRSSPFVRGHALQAALLHVAPFPVAAIVLPVSWVINLHGLAMLIGLLVLAAEVLAHGAGIVRALRGKPFRVPLLGTWLERQLGARSLPE